MRKLGHRLDRFEKIRGRPTAEKGDLQNVYGNYFEDGDIGQLTGDSVNLCVARQGPTMDLMTAVFVWVDWSDPNA